jgi:hypothetical protein
MKTTTKTLLALLAICVSAFVVNAQDAGGPPPGGEQPPPADGPGSGPTRASGRRPARSLLMDALDTNHDGVIDSNEIANASAALKKLDKNGDGKLTPDELFPERPKHGDAQRRPQRHQGPPPDGDGQGGPQGPNNRQAPPPDN